MSPYLELVDIKEQDSFKVWAHGYPYETVRWHFHPEYELNLITETSGRFFVGDHTGTFTPGQLCMVGPNLPHKWVSELPNDQPVARRCVVLQFSGKCSRRGIEAFAERSSLERMLTASDQLVTDICYVCGFNNLSNFNRQFVAAKGMPPSQFRRYHRLNVVFDGSESTPSGSRAAALQH